MVDRYRFILSYLIEIVLEKVEEAKAFSETKPSGWLDAYQESVKGFDDFFHRMGKEESILAPIAECYAARELLAQTVRRQTDVPLAEALAEVEKCYENLSNRLKAN